MPRPPVGSGADWLAHEWDASVEENVAISMEYLAAIHELCRRDGIELVVTGVPHYPQYSGLWSARPHAVLDEACEKMGITFFNSYELLAPQIRGSQQADYYWETDPTHFGSAGNAIWARPHLAVLDPLVGKRRARAR